MHRTHCLPRPQKVCQTSLGLGMRIVLWDFLAMLTADVENNKHCIVTELSEIQKQKWKNVKLHRIYYMLSKEARDMYFVKINLVYGMDQFKVLNQVVHDSDLLHPLYQADIFYNWSVVKFLGFQSALIISCISIVSH